MFGMNYHACTSYFILDVSSAFGGGSSRSEPSAAIISISKFLRIRSKELLSYDQCLAPGPCVVYRVGERSVIKELKNIASRCARSV